MATMGEINRGGLPDLDRKSRSGFFFHPDASRLSRSGTPDLPDWSGWIIFFSRFIETPRDKSGKVENTGDIEIISKSPDFLDFPRLFFLVLRCPRKIPTFCSIFEVIRGPKIPTYLDISTYPDIYNLPFRLNWTTSTNDLFPRIFPKYPDFPRNILTYPDLTEQWNLRKLYFWK